MQAFIIELRNVPGEVARVTETLAHKGINITGFTGSTCGDSGSVCLLTNDEAGSRSALREAGYKVRERELVVASVADRPGALADVTRRLADAGVNIEAAMPTGMSGGEISVAFATDDATKAREALGDRVHAGITTR